MANSQVRAKGIGKSAVRHDLDGTPGLQDSDLVQGEVSEFEQGQKSVQDTRSVSAVPAQQAPAAQSTNPMQVPDPVEFAMSKLGGGNLQEAGQEVLEKRDFSRWLPLLRRLAVSPTASGLLQRAYVERISTEMNRPMGGSATVIRQRDFDTRLEAFNAS